jgi:hypothetical protein
MTRKRRDRAECLQFAADGKVKADIELQPLASINTIFERLEKGRRAFTLRARFHERIMDGGLDHSRALLTVFQMEEADRLAVAD